MGLLAPSSCADFCAPILGSPASIFPTLPLNAANSPLSNTISLLRFTSFIPDITPSHAHLSPSLLRDRHTHCLQLRSVPCYPQIVVLFPPSRLYSLRPNIARHFPCFTRIYPYALTAHFPHPLPLLAHIPSLINITCTTPCIIKKKKIICCHVQVPPGIHTRVRPLNSVVAHGSRRVWLSILRLVITIITFRPRAFSTPSQILHFVYILSFEYLVPVSRYCLSFLDRVEAEGRLQRWSCYSNIQICDLGERVPRMYLFQVSVEN